MENYLELLSEDVTLLKESTLPEMDVLIGNIIKEVYPKSITAQICSVQPISTPTGKIICTKRKADGYETKSKLVDTISKETMSDLSVEAISDTIKQYKKSGVTLLKNALAANITEEMDQDTITLFKSKAKDMGVLSFTTNVAGDAFTELKAKIELATFNISTDVKRSGKMFVIGSEKVVSAITTVSEFVFEADLKQNNPWYVGTIGTKRYFLDPFATDDYCLVGYLGNRFGESGYVFSPYNISANIFTKASDGQKAMKFLNRYALTENPLNEGSESQFMRKFSVDFSNTIYA